MSTKSIPRGSSSFVMEADIPSWWTPTDTVAITIKDADTGTTLVASTAATLYTADTLASAASAGAFSVVLTTGNALVEGDRVLIGTASNGYHPYTVDDFASATKTLTLTEGLQEAVPSGGYVRGAFMRYTINVSSFATSVVNLHVAWKPSTSGPAFTELWTIDTYRADVGALEAEFRDRFEPLYNTIPDRFDRFQTAARERIRQEFSIKGRSFDRVVDSEAIREVYLIEIALLVAMSNGMETEQYNRLQRDRQRQMEILDALALWTDDTQDGTKGDTETQPAMIRGYSRGL